MHAGPWGEGGGVGWVAVVRDSHNILSYLPDLSLYICMYKHDCLVILCLVTFPVGAMNVYISTCICICVHTYATRLST